MANYSRELRMGGDIRQKRKVEKGNRICEEIEKSIRGSRGSIEKDSGGNEKVCRQK